MAASWVDLIAQSAGEYSLHCAELDSPVTLTHRADTVVEAASTIKVAILLALLDANQHKRLSLRRRVDLKRSQVGLNGSGLLQSMYFNTPFTLYNLAFLMMSVSDNVATNAVIELLGFDYINQFIATKLGLNNTRLCMELLNFETNYSFIISPPMAYTTARELTTMLSALVQKELLDPYHTRIALKMMASVQRSTFNRRLPTGSVKRFWSKTGWIVSLVDRHQVLNECGIMESSSGKKYIFALLANMPLDSELEFSVDAPARQEFASVAGALLAALTAAHRSSSS